MSSTMDGFYAKRKSTLGSSEIFPRLFVDIFRISIGYLARTKLPGANMSFCRLSRKACPRYRGLGKCPNGVLLAASAQSRALCAVTIGCIVAQLAQLRRE